MQPARSNTRLIAALCLAAGACSGNIEGPITSDLDDDIDSDGGRGGDASKIVLMPGQDGPGANDGVKRDTARQADSGPPVPSCSGQAICDTFESTANVVGGAPKNWTVETQAYGPGRVLVDTARAFSGKNSVRIIAGEWPYRTQLQHRIAFPKNAFYGRMMAWVRAVPSVTRHWTFLEARGWPVGSNRTLAEEGIAGYGGSVATKTLSAYYVESSLDCEQSSAHTMPLQRWVCVEWQFDGAANEMRMWLDGAAMSQLTVTHPGCGGTWDMPVFESIGIGFWNAQDAGVEMWVDDVAIDDTRIGCPSVN